MTGQCFECNKRTKFIHFHHVVPKCLGGTRTVPLCEGCHGLVHDYNFTHRRNLQKKGIEKAKAEGKYTGRQKGSYKHSPEEIKKMLIDREKGMSVTDLSIKYDATPPTIYRHIREANENTKRDET